MIENIFDVDLGHI